MELAEGGSIGCRVAGRFAGVVGLRIGRRGQETPPYTRCLPQERFVQATIDGDHLAGGLAEALTDQKEVRFSLIGRSDR